MPQRYNYRKQKIRSLRKRRKFYQFRSFWVLLLCLVLGGVVAYFALFFSKVQVRQVEITGNQKVATQDVETLAWKNINNSILWFSTQSIFLEDPNALKANMLEQFPQIEDVKIQKKYFSSISIAITERQPFALFCELPANCFSIDKNGIIFEKTPPTPDSLIITSGHDQLELFEGKHVIETKTIQAIAEVKDSLKQHFNIDLKEALAANPLVFKTSEQWKAYFDPAADIGLQITKMNLLLKDDIPESARKKLQYIYLQYKDRAYYK